MIIVQRIKLFTQSQFFLLTDHLLETIINESREKYIPAFIV